MGLAGYYKSFIAGFSKILTPLLPYKGRGRSFNGQKNVKEASNN
jgi:hypothetical protein